MVDFSNSVDLPLIWGLIIAIAVLLYVVLDGFDLGVGILFPFAPTDKCRDRMINSIAPFWDGNETWLVLGGGGLFAAFPLAYSILLPAFYIPIISMLLFLVMRGVAFEFRFKAEGSSAKRLWDYVFHIGSLGAGFFQGVIIGAFVKGVEVDGRNFSGNPFDWASAFSMLTGIAVVFGYALLGSTWLIMKTSDLTQDWSRKVACYAASFVAFFIVVVCVSMPLIDTRIERFWFSYPNFYIVLLLLNLGIVVLASLFKSILNKNSEYKPFFLTVALFIKAYLGISLSLYPWIVPYKYSFSQAAASGPGLSLMLIGVVPALPIILVYVSYCYYVFRGKANEQKSY